MLLNLDIFEYHLNILYRILFKKKLFEISLKN